MTSLQLNTHTKVDSIADELHAFMAKHIIPYEALLAKDSEESQHKVKTLQREAGQKGLFGNFYPAEFGGHFNTLSDYLPSAEKEGFSEYGPKIFGAEASVDIHMLHHHANERIRQTFLAPLSRGAISASYAMSEPDTCGSVPDTINAQAELKNGHWHITGRKWFICRADCAQFVSVVVCTDPSQSLKRRLSIIIVPVDTPGFSIVDQLKVFNQHHGQCSLMFDNVKVPEDFLLGDRGCGLAIMHQRLKLGRILRSTHWLGLAQRCFELMCQRIYSDRGVLIDLADKQLVRQHVVNVYRAIFNTRALVKAAAAEMDDRRPADIAVNLAKLSASQTLNLAADCAIQIFGAEGVSNRTPLADIYQSARSTRILDGADEALISSLGKNILRQYAPEYALNQDVRETPLYMNRPCPHE